MKYKFESVSFTSLWIKFGFEYWYIFNYHVYFGVFQKYNDILKNNRKILWSNQKNIRIIKNPFLSMYQIVNPLVYFWLFADTQLIFVSPSDKMNVEE